MKGGEDAVMSNLRLVPRDRAMVEPACSLCGATGCPWDHIAGRPWCLDCQEGLIHGESAPVREVPRANPCVICNRGETMSFLTFPLFDPDPIEMDLCEAHLNALLGRRLSAEAYRKLRRRLNKLGFAIEQFFLLHEAFYDEDGTALQPLPEVI